MRKVAIAAVAVAAAVLPATARAQSGLIRCSVDSFANTYAVGNLVTNSAMGCAEANSLTGSYQKAIFNGNEAIARSKYISWTYNGVDQGTFRIEFSVINPGQELARYQIFGVSGEAHRMFCSYMTTQ